MKTTQSRVTPCFGLSSRTCSLCTLFNVRWHVIECSNHDIVVGLCSGLFMRLSYYNHQGYGKKLSSQMGIELWSFRLRAVYSTPRPGVGLSVSAVCLRSDVLFWVQNHYISLVCCDGVLNPGHLHRESNALNNRQGGLLVVAVHSELLIRLSYTIH